MKIEPPTYHDVYITTLTMPRTSIFDLPFRVVVRFCRTAGWEVWALASEGLPEELLGAEYGGPEKPLRLEIRDHVIVDSLSQHLTPTLDKAAPP